MTEPQPDKAILNAPPMTQANRAEMRQALERAIRIAETNRLVVRVPHESKAVQSLRGMHYHYRPELFLQLQGTTDFQFPREEFTVREDELCVIPAGVPHAETARPGAGRPFRNLVAGFYNHSLSLHFAFEARPGRPDIESIEFFDTQDLHLFLTLASSLVQASLMRSPAQDAVKKGLLLALLGLFRNVVETGTDRLNEDVGKVFRAKCLVREQFSNPGLRVQHIAQTLGCSADYLSHLFHAETKERLTHYIQRIRIEGAILALQSSSLNVSEIAYASGFADPAYFARVFRQHKGMTPQAYRMRLDASRRRKENRPKTVYADRLDFSPGAPVRPSPALSA